MLRLCLFDCDGTLVDSQHSIITAMQTAFRADHRAAPAADAIRHIVGLSLEDAVAALLGVSDADTCRTIATNYVAAIARSRTLQPGGEPLFPGAREALDALAARGWLLGIATGKSRRGLQFTLAEHGLADRFVTLQTADVAAGKPAPDMVLRAAAETGVAVEATVVVGDTVFDMSMARSAGALAIGVAWGYHPSTALLSAGAELIAGSFAELIEALDSRDGLSATGPPASSNKEAAP
jgi:phosphoglycolate phosphatase